MGLFDKKRRDEFDSPVDVVDLSRGADGPAADTARPAVAREPEPAPEPADYGIGRAIELMRTLPMDNVELVVRVVKFTLESARVKVSTIIADANEKIRGIEKRIAQLKGQISELEGEIASRKKEIGELEADHKETTTVRERLELAEKLTAKTGGSEPAQRQSAHPTPSPASSAPGTTPRVEAVSAAVSSGPAKK